MTCHGESAGTLRFHRASRLNELLTLLVIIVLIAFIVIVLVSVITTTFTWFISTHRFTEALSNPVRWGMTRI